MRRRRRGAAGPALSDIEGALEAMDAEELREVTRRMEGAEGLAKIARATRRANDLRAWCRSLVEEGDWKAALRAFEEAAELVTGKEYELGWFLDGAALAAQKLGRRDLPARLERAWRRAPSMLRLRRWLGTARGKGTLRKRAAEALEACPKQARRQRAFVHVVLGEFASAAKRLAAAPGLGWSDGEHPWHLLFPLFQALLGGKGSSLASGGVGTLHGGMDIEEMDLVAAGRNAPAVAAPETDRILEQAGIRAVAEGMGRDAVVAAMRKAAERRVEGVIGKGRRRHYGHAASLVAACAGLDPSPATSRWVARMRDEHRRYPALRAELDRHVGAR